MLNCADKKGGRPVEPRQVGLLFSFLPLRLGHGLVNRRCNQFSQILPGGFADDTTGRIHRYLAIRFDIGEKCQLLHSLQWRVVHEVLTGLPNRAFLSDLLDQALAFSREENIPLAVYMLDLDGFKAVSDGYGHASGDLLLVEVARRLLDIVRGEDVVARLAGDEFVLVLRYVRDVPEVRAALNRVLGAISAPYLLRGKALNVFASIGISLFPDDNQDAETLLRHADAGG